MSVERTSQMKTDTYVELLDHGSIALVETWGSDERIIEAARMSTQKGFEGWGPKGWKCDTKNRIPMSDCTWEYGETGVNDNFIECPRCKGPVVRTPGDEKLLAFLWKNNHATPFEMAGAIVEVQAPIFVFREWHRHRTQSYNEMSARYAPLPDVNYIPSIERLMLGGDGKNKQAGTVKDAAVLTEENAQRFREHLDYIYGVAQGYYKEALEMGVPKELARVHLPVARYSKMRASANLRNWLSFLTLRQAPQAQFEIRQYANALHAILAAKFPRTLALFDEGKQRC